jgi:hypothetical protein
MPCCVAAERYAEGEVLGYRRAGCGIEYVGFEVVHEVRCVGCGAVVAAEHVLGVAGVALSPGFVMQLVDLSAAMIALVECHGNKTFRVLTRFAALYTRIPCGDDLDSYGRHGIFGLEAGVEQP